MKKWLTRSGWMALGIAGLYGASALAGVVSGGPIDPPGPVGPTMKTLDDIPGAWNRKLSPAGTDACATERFDCVLQFNAGVHDRQTGLVWERTPGGVAMGWQEAFDYCAALVLPIERGWRLPTLPELLSLLEQSNLPPGTPFEGIDATAQFWTSTAPASEPNMAYPVDFMTGSNAPAYRMELRRPWCVRGAEGSNVPHVPAYEDSFDSWDTVLPSGPLSRFPDTCRSPRFTCVLDGIGVRDNETGLVWEKQSSASIFNWEQAFARCQNGSIAGRQGWRLPRLDELQSLYLSVSDPDPFLGSMGNAHWSSTPSMISAGFAWLYYPETGTTSVSGTTATINVICVRGPGGGRQ